MSTHPGHGTNKCIHGYVLSQCRCFMNSVIHLVACPRGDDTHDQLAHAMEQKDLATASQSAVETRTEPSVGADLAERLDAILSDLSAIQVKLNEIKIKIAELEKRS